MHHYSKNNPFKRRFTYAVRQWSVAFLCFVGGCLFMTTACKSKSRAEIELRKGTQTDSLIQPEFAVAEPPLAKIPVIQDITIGRFFKFMDEIVTQYDTLGQYSLQENLLLRANAWILDTLVQTDYYYQMSLGNFVYDQRKTVVLHRGDTLCIPGPQTAAYLLDKMSKTWLDINIPAFELRIMEGDSVVFSMPVRVGKDQKKYLELAGGQVDLRTKTGEGSIIRVNRYPLFLDPVTGEKFKFTKRDDRKVTYMPQIPWLEPSINGARYGQMIHPTTNPRTLGHAASNGCIGVSEANGWRVYFFAPVGTRVRIRYDLETIRGNGDTLQHEDIYHLKKKAKTAQPLVVAGFTSPKNAGICTCDTMF